MFIHHTQVGMQLKMVCKKIFDHAKNDDDRDSKLYYILGVNKWLLDTLGLKYSTSKTIISNVNDSNLGAGRFCNLEQHITVGQALENVKKNTNLKSVQLGLAVGSTLESPIKTVAVCAGSGASILKNIGADLYLTGEMSHHEVLDANHKGTTCILLNHSNSERQFLFRFQEILETKVNGVPIIVSKKDMDPLINH